MTAPPVSWKLIAGGSRRNPKWYDTRAKTGGGGAIDLAMHVRQVSFVEAVKLLTGRGSAHG